MKLKERILDILGDTETDVTDEEVAWLVDDLKQRVDELEAENARLLDDPGGNRAGKYTRRSEESRLAALRMIPKSGTKRRRVLNVLIRTYPEGLADEQIHNAVGGDIRSVNARRKELEEGGWVVKADWKWHAPSGNDVAVWVLSSTAVDVFGG